MSNHNIFRGMATIASRSGAHAAKLGMAASCGVLLFSGTMSAQEGRLAGFTFQAGAGFTQPVGNTGRKLDTGWNVGGGGGLRLGTHFTAMINLKYNSFGINSTTLTDAGYPGGSLQVFSATFDPTFHVALNRRVNAYISGGGGLFHRYQEFTQPSVATVPYFDPFFGYYPVAISANQVLASSSVNKPGIDVGAGLEFGTRWHGKFFAEARYNRILATRHIDYVPVTFGFRW